ncbi:DUF2510 domain-containing protein [Microlunatus soli]|uniref:DUF2510 domain-containing protein n=1 Tax=Microlunatus soli TaxID=630515 RepID=A0A1H1Q3P1_9ACTN|nr:DUF2510 domain-containing protein [Microlunatus soli]SDS17953.1 Protein of unknown function [Microlunatus soli]
MAATGWYPDPDGTPGRYRYWDGRQWSAETTDNPSIGSPTGGGPIGSSSTAQPASGAGRQAARRGRTGLILAALAVLLVVVVIATLVIRSLGDQRPGALGDPDPPESSVSGWDDSSPLPTASPPPTGDSTGPTSAVACAAGAPGSRNPHPSDGRLHGGRLSLEQPGSPWRRDDRYASGLSYAYDVSGASEQVEPSWFAMVAVGELHADDGFRRPKQAADGVLQCIASSFYYEYFTGRKDLSSKRFALDGHSGWSIRSEIRVDDPAVQAAGDVVEVIVLDTGDADRLSLFAGFVPIGDAARISQLDEVISGLRVD